MQNSNKKLDLVIIGAGFAGLYSLYKAQKQNLKAIVIEKASDVGGTWYWNRYPGARCDVESMQYSFQFSKELEEEWEWSEQYATQPEILKYANHVADRLNLKKNIKFDTEVISAHYQDKSCLWKIIDNKNIIYEAEYCIMATGCLSKINQPKFQDMHLFKGPILHTGKWPHEKVNLKNKRVGIIGTGSSAIQTIPEIIQDVKSLHVFQRTPHYTVPARNRPLKYLGKKVYNTNKSPIGYDKDLYVEEIKAKYKEFRNKAKNSFAALAMPVNEENALEVSALRREEVYENRWKMGGTPFITAFLDLNKNRDANETAAEFVRSKIRSIVKNKNVSEKLLPTYPIGCKRLAVDTDYYKTFNNPKVNLVDIKNKPIKNFTSEGIVVNDKTYNLDIVIMATGFDAMTGALLHVDIKGKNNYTLKEKWKNGPKTYLGIASESFPNMFMVSGPGSPSVLTNMLVSIEQHVDWIFECIDYMKVNKLKTIEPSKEAENSWVDHNQDVAKDHVRSSCNSWYIGANIEGKARIFMPYVGGFPEYVKKCNEVSKNNYEGFHLK